MAAATLIELTGIIKEYVTPGGIDVPVLHGIDLVIHRGEFIAIMGQSGSGKSTLMNILGCLDTPTAGRFVLDGRDVSVLGDAQLAAVRNKMIGFVFQGFNLLKRMSALDNVALPLAYAGVPKREARRRARARLEQTGLGEFAGRLPNQLSGGQQQRVAIARALAMEPDVLLFDEPTSALDPRLVGEVLAVIADLAAGGQTMVIVTHEIAFARRVAHRVVVVDAGVVAESGTPDEVLDRPRTAATRALLAME